jgi:hypothetical protein
MRPTTSQFCITKRSIRGENIMKTTVKLSMLAAAALLSLGVGASAQQIPQAPNTTFFVTSAGPGKGADLGGLAGADAHCQQLATTVGAGGKTWHAYLSTTANAPGGPVNARDRIGKGPWQNSKGAVIAKDVDDLHSASNNLNKDTALTERGNMIAGAGMTPNWHDALTGSQADGRAWQANLNLTCGNWTSSTFGSAMLGHIDRSNNSSWNAAHMSRSCSQPDLVATGGNGLFYCFAAQ